MRKSINNPRKNRRGRGMKKVFACLLSLSMIPVSGIAVFTDHTSTIVQAQEAKEVTFAKDSLTTTVGCFKEFRFNNIDINDIREVTYKVADESILKIKAHSVYDQTTGYESPSSEYVPQGQKAGETTVTATIQKRDGTTITVGPEKFIVKDQENPDVLPIKSYELYGALQDKNGKSVDTNENGQIEKDEIKKIENVNFSSMGASRNFTSEELSFLSDATECTELNLNADEKLTNIDFAKNMHKLKSVDLRGTSLTTLGTVLDDVKDQIEYLGLYGTKIPLAERSSYIKTNEINIVEASKKMNFIQPEGLIGANDIDNITIGNNELVSCGLEYGRDLYLKSAKDTAGKSTDLEIKDGDTVKKIKINIKAKDDTIPCLAETSMTTSMSCFPKIKCKNMDDNTWVEMTSKDTSVVKIANDHDPWEDRLTDSRYLEPQSVGTTEISVQFHRNGETYDDTLKVEVKPIEKGVIPLVSYAEYFGLLDKDYNHVDKNKDYKIDENEIKDVDMIYTHDSGMTNESLQGLEKAVNCTYFSTECKGITNIDLLKNFPKLSKVDLSYSGVKDLSVLKNIKEQLTVLRLYGVEIPASERYEFIRTKEITLPEGGKVENLVEPYGVITYEDTVKIEDENVAAMTNEYVEEYDGEIEVLVAKGKIGDTTKLVVTNGNSKIEIPIKIVAKSETKDPEKPAPEKPAPEKPAPEKPDSTKPSEEKPQNPNNEISAPAQSTTATSKKVEKITVTAPSNKLTTGKKIKLTANISNDASNKNIKWSTSNKKYATVDKNGVVKFNKKAAGKTVIITVMATDGSGKKATFKIKIMKGSVQKITISGAKSVKAGKTLKLKAKVKASKGANKKLTWTSSNTKYATVSSSGKVKALKAGKKKSVKITAMATDGSGKKATITIKIK